MVHFWKPRLKWERMVRLILHVYSFAVGSSFINTAIAHSAKQIISISKCNHLTKSYSIFTLNALKTETDGHWTWLDIERHSVYTEWMDERDKSIVLNDQITTLGQKR